MSIRKKLQKGQKKMSTDDHGRMVRLNEEVKAKLFEMNQIIGRYLGDAFDQSILRYNPKNDEVDRVDPKNPIVKMMWHVHVANICKVEVGGGGCENFCTGVCEMC